MKMSKILSIVTAETGVSKIQLQEQDRSKERVFARMMFTYIARKLGYTYTEISQELQRDHTTIMHLYKKSNSSELIKEIFKNRNIESETTHIKNISITNQRRYGYIYERYGGKCLVCGFNSIIEICHIIPRYIGGTNEPSNLIVLCPNHHAMFDRGMLKIKDIPIKIDFPQS